MQMIQSSSSENVSRILVAGSHANNLCNLCNGWTISWQRLSCNNNIVGKLINSDKITNPYPIQSSRFFFFFCFLLYIA